MGRGIRERIIQLLFICLPLFAFTQIRIGGTVKDELGNNQANAILRLQDSEGNIIAYTNSMANGTFELNIEEQAQDMGFYCRRLGFAEQIKSIDPNAPIQTIDFVLKKQTTDLQEVVIDVPKAIIVKEDTITYRTDAFTDGTEQTVEDMLNKIPGIDVDDDGGISVNGINISKLLVDGDDLFDSDYKILSKNMPAYPIEELDVLQNYSENRMLKGIEDSKDVAIDLKLGEAFKGIWFGNAEGAYGNDNFYSVRGNLMNFGKKNKYYLLTQLNNIGEGTGGGGYTFSNSTISKASIGDVDEIRPILSLEPDQLEFNANRTVFNDAELVSLSAIFNPNKKLKIQPRIILDGDENDFFRNNISSTNVNGANFTNTENFSLRNNRQGIDANIELNYTPANNQSLVVETRYIYGKQLDRTNIRFNGIASNEDLNHRRSFLDQKITFTHKPAARKVWVYTGRLKHETRPQTYRYDDFLLDDLFSGNNERLQQTVDTRMLFLGAEARRLHRMNNGDLWEMRFGNTFRSDALQSAFSLQDNAGQNTFPVPHQNDFSYGVNDLFIKNSYQKKLGKLSLNADLDLHQFFNQIHYKIGNPTSIQNQNQTQNETPFFINPKLGLRWALSDKNKLSASYSFATRNAKTAQVLPNFVLTNYRNFQRGTNAFDQLASSSWTFNHRYGNFQDRFLSSTSIIFTKNHDFFSTNSLVSQNFTQAQYQLFRDRETIFINTKLDYFFKPIATNLKLDLGYNLSNYANIVNNSPVRNVRSAQYTYGLELRSGFDGPFNFNIGTKWRRNTIRTGIENSFTNNLSFLDLTFFLHERFDVQVQSERYHFGNLSRTPNYYFLDVQARYTFKNKKLNLSLRGKNLFNTQTFRNFSISDIGVSTTAFDLLPRFLLLKLEYRFGQRPPTAF